MPKTSLLVVQVVMKSLLRRSDVRRSEEVVSLVNKMDAVWLLGLEFPQVGGGFFDGFSMVKPSKTIVTMVFSMVLPSKNRRPS